MQSDGVVHGAVEVVGVPFRRTRAPADKLVAHARRVVRLGSRLAVEHELRLGVAAAMRVERDVMTLFDMGPQHDIRVGVVGERVFRHQLAGILCLRRFFGGVPTRDALRGGKRQRDVGGAHRLARADGLGYGDATLIVHELHVVRADEHRVYRDGLGLADGSGTGREVSRGAALRQRPAHELGAGFLGGCRSVQRLPVFYLLLGYDRALGVEELIRGNRRSSFARDDVDGEVSCLNRGVGAHVGGDLFGSGSFAIHVVDINLLALHARVTERDDDLLVGLNLVVVLVGQRDVDCLEAADFFAIGVRALFNGVSHRAGVDRGGLQLDAFGQRARRGGYVNRHAVGLGVELRCRILRTVFRFLNICLIIFSCFGRGSFVFGPDGVEGRVPHARVLIGGLVDACAGGVSARVSRPADEGVAVSAHRVVGQRDRRPVGDLQGLRSSICAVRVEREHVRAGIHAHAVDGVCDAGGLVDELNGGRAALQTCGDGVLVEHRVRRAVVGHLAAFHDVGDRDGRVARNPIVVLGAVGAGEQRAAALAGVERERVLDGSACLLEGPRVARVGNAFADSGNRDSVEAHDRRQQQRRQRLSCGGRPPLLRTCSHPFHGDPHLSSVSAAFAAQLSQRARYAFHMIGTPRDDSPRLS